MTDISSFAIVADNHNADTCAFFGRGGMTPMTDGKDGIVTYIVLTCKDLIK